MRTATITFHASHNYGSALQAYALQQIIKGLGHENKIINLRTYRQIDLYNVFTKRRGIKYIVKNISHLIHYSALRKKHANFEAFMREKLDLTENTYSSLEEIENDNLNYDCYIAGSDQIWNPIPCDFDWAYYLPFVKTGRKVSYATSFGQLASTGNNEIKAKISTYLKYFDYITVREVRAAENVNEMIGLFPQIVLDPTLLLSRADWLSIISQKRVVEGEYIFLYTLSADSEILKMAKTISRKLKLPVVVSNFSNQYDVFNCFEKYYDCGPLEFLNLINNAKFVLTSSFHGTAFSTIFQKDFLAIRGNKDARISSLLARVGLSDRVLNGVDEIENKKLLGTDYEYSCQHLVQAVQESRELLKQIIEG